jgi:RNA polymerase sigma-70 factor (ECF subfamily)
VSDAETTLLAGLRSGDDAAYEELVRSYGGRLLAVTRRLLGDEDDARDAVQEAFLSAFKSIDRFQGESLVSTWLHRIAVNAALMKLRSRRRRPEDRIDDLLPQFLEDGHPAQPAVPWRELSDSQLVREETRGRVRAAIDRLPEGYRTILVLRDIEELDTAEVAEQLGMTRNAVKTRLHRARQALRGLLAPEFQADGSPPE